MAAEPDKPLFLLQGSPLISGGKARLMSNRKVKPNRAKARDVTGPEESGYTTEAHKALCREDVEACSPAWVDAEVELAKQRDLARLVREHETAQLSRRFLSAEHRMLDAHRRARLQRIDVTGELHVMRKMLARGKDRDVEARLERLEARLDGLPFEEAA